MSLKRLTNISLSDAMSIPLSVEDWVAFASGPYSEIQFGQIIRFCEKSMIIKKRRGKEVRKISRQVIKVSKEQLTLMMFSK
jgi:hypothetical protein